MTALPTKRDETWRYSDLEAVARVWPVATHAHVVPAGETLALPILLDAADDAVTIEDHEIEIGASAQAIVHVAITSGRLGRVFVKVRLAEGAHFELTGAIVGGGSDTHEIVTRVTHAEPNATSAQTVRIVLGGQATGSYLGKVAVARDAQKTDATQSAKAMLLARTATANLKPELEIYADDVKCAHGATVGELDAQALFYLAARGIPPAEAKALLLRAFVGGLFEGTPDETRFDAAIDAALEKML
ncbi:SufD family Fe-S cluster assembly protein [Sphingomonas sp. BIUV-7]|uniref:SufD family Fe-S cluster assembly protein n=1 Tax=Sphingomonas natans TaxID=3063330 RepID=A0ABT8YE99_9SPHN|nr:SufD family Fe-S cluster assembly protein [Sphingomonas sp. BIUV-7]MDO6416672.1 SufD family Fe-S cluster assembly protein [Sphingomonas sp. BIUV-7]